MTSHYPTTAELAALRRSIRPGMAVGTGWSRANGRAWLSEIHHGIGWRLSAAPYADTIWPHRTMLARQDASAMRSRAYATWGAEDHGRTDCHLHHTFVRGPDGSHLDIDGMPYTSDGLDCHPIAS